MADDQHELFEKACNFALEAFKFEKFKALQLEALSALVSQRDVFVNLHTGSGKSAIFQSFPLISDYIENRTTPTRSSIALIISPLVSLMQDQVLYLTSKGISAAYIGEEQTDDEVTRGILEGKFQLFYGSPESFLTNQKWRSMLSSEVYRNKLKRLAVDEAHCICHWGFAPKKGEKVFRKWFSRINELRSIIPSRVPVLALTATATTRTRERIIRTLEMNNVLVVKESPDRPNIAYSVQVVGTGTMGNFEPLIDGIKKYGVSHDRIIIYCQTIMAVTHVYGHFQAHLGAQMYKDASMNPRERLVEMFHARIDELNKEHILKSFSQADGHIRIVVATIAYGMGIDCKGVKYVIHYGPSRNLEAYLQESGRAGRSGEDKCAAVILYNNVMVKHCDDAIVSYVRSTTCRRKTLMEHFDVDLTTMKLPDILHECCDVCQLKCKCQGVACNYSFSKLTVPVLDQAQAPDDDKVRDVTEMQREKLVTKLDYLRKCAATQQHAVMSGKTPMFTPPSLTLSGLSDLQYTQVLEHCERLFTLQDLYKYVDVWQQSLGIDIMCALETVFGDTGFQYPEEEDVEILDSDVHADDLLIWDLSVEDSALLEIPDEYLMDSDEDLPV